MSKIHQHLSTDHPCRARRNKKTLPTPQLPEEDRPCGWKWCELTYKKTDTGYKCLYCNEESNNSTTIQQHCVKHFPPTFHCKDCGDSFHLKTEYTQHLRSICEYCSANVRKVGLEKHYLSKKCIRVRKKKGIVTEYDTDERERAAPEPLHIN